MDLRSLQSKVSKALSSSNVRLQNSAIISLISEVERYVENIREDEETICDIRNYEREAQRLQRSDDPEAVKEFAEIQKLISEARQIESEMRARKQTIRSLKQDVERLHRSLQKIS